MPTYEQLGFGQGAALTGDRARGVFGQVMGLVALALGFAALGAYILRDSTGGTGIIFFIGAFACIFGLQAAAARGHEQLAIGLLFGMALLLGMAISPIIVYYVKTELNDAWFDSPGGQKQIAGFPRRRLGTEASLDAPLLLLCSRHAEFITGSLFTIDESCGFVQTNSTFSPRRITSRASRCATSICRSVFWRSMMWIPLRSAKMKRRILGFHRRV